MAREYMYTVPIRDMRLCMWEARKILWAVFDTRAVYVVILARIRYNWPVYLGSECRVGVFSWCS